MSEHAALTPSRTPFITLVRFFERRQANRKPGSARPDLEKLLNAFQSTEEGRADLFSFYRLLFPQAPDRAVLCCRTRLIAVAHAEFCRDASFSSACAMQVDDLRGNYHLQETTLITTLAEVRLCGSCSSCVTLAQVVR